MTKGLWSSAALAAVMGAVLAGCGDRDDEVAAPARPVKTVVVEPIPAGLMRRYPAVVLPAQEAELSFRVSGRIVELPALAATAVEQGEVIAQLDTRDFEAEVDRLESQRAQAEAQLRSMRAGARDEEVAALEAAVAAAEARFEAARDQVARTQTLFDKDIASQAQLDAHKTDMDVAEADLNARKEELAQGKAGARQEEIEAQEAVIAGLDAQLSTANANLADTTLRAPFSGIVAARMVDNFTNVQANTPIVVLQKLETIDLVFDVPGPDVTEVADAGNLAVAATFDAIPDTAFEAELVEFSTEADPATQTYRTRVSIENPQHVTILPGMVGTVSVAEEEPGEEALAVPAAAVTSEADGTAFVWVVDPATDAVSKRPVEIGDLTEASAVVNNGLNAGDVVVIAGISQLQPDMKVRPVTEIGD